MATRERDAWAEGDPEEVARGVHRIALPLPGDGLKAVNVYAIEEGQDLTLIDGGWALDRSRNHLEAALASLDHDLGDVRQFLVTHVHRDHYELAMRIGAELGSRVALGIGERPTLESLRDAHTEADPLPLRDRLLAAGADALVRDLERQWDGRHESAKVDWRLPDVWLQDRQRIELSERHLEVLATPGHTQGHVVFIDGDAGLLFAGDHILPHITPSIGFERVPVESALSDYLASLALVRSLPDLRMLPAHGPVRPTTHDRIDELLVHHDHRLDLMEEAVKGGAQTAYEVAALVPWTRRSTRFDALDVFNQMLAVNETAAHLDALVARERLQVTLQAGICCYDT